MISGRAAGLVAAALVAGSCGGGDGAQVPPSPEGPGAADPVVAEGEALFNANCSECHGPEGTGTDSGPPLVHQIYEPSHHPDESFRRAVRGGVQPHHWDFGPMPPVANLTDEEIEAIVAYVRALQEEAGIF